MSNRSRSDEGEREKERERERGREEKARSNTARERQWHYRVILESPLSSTHSPLRIPIYTATTRLEPSSERNLDVLPFFALALGSVFPSLPRRERECKREARARKPLKTQPVDVALSRRCQPRAPRARASERGGFFSRVRGPFRPCSVEVLGQEI